MNEMIAQKSFVYAGKRLKVGDTFMTRSGQDARLLKAIGHAAFVLPKAEPLPEPVKLIEPPVAIEQEISENVVAAEPAAADVESKPARKRVYRRRDLQAE